MNIASISNTNRFKISKAIVPQNKSQNFGRISTSNRIIAGNIAMPIGALFLLLLGGKEPLINKKPLFKSPNEFSKELVDSIKTISPKYRAVDSLIECSRRHIRK